MQGLHFSILVSLLLLQPGSSYSNRLDFGNGNGNGNGNGKNNVNDEIEDLEDRIVGGEIAGPGEFPFFVQWRGCGASLIHGDILLTAAHCQPIGSNDVLVGAYLKWQPEGEPVNSVERKIVERRVHPLWNPTTLKYDIMVMKLDEMVELPPVKLDSGSEGLGLGQEVTVMGFGTTQPRIEVDYDSTNLEDITVSNPFEAMREAEYFEVEAGFSLRTEILQKVTIDRVDTETCNGIFDSFIDEDSMMCAGTSEGGKDACFGDSGSPLVGKSSDGTMVQVGVVSFGEGCGRAEKPGVYSMVSGSYEWISKVVCDMSSNKPKSCFPSPSPTLEPSAFPSGNPSLPPSNIPSRRPTTINPSDLPYLVPSVHPSDKPTKKPSMQPILSLTNVPTVVPSTQSNNVPSTDTSETIRVTLTRLPSFTSSLVVSPVIETTSEPTTIPSPPPSNQPSVVSSTRPSSTPSTNTSVQPSGYKSQSPTLLPSLEPTRSSVPTTIPSPRPSNPPSVVSSTRPSSTPSNNTSAQPSGYKSQSPTPLPSLEPTSATAQPSSVPTTIPSPRPSNPPSVVSSTRPSNVPSTEPSMDKSQSPTSLPSLEPTRATAHPSSVPTRIPSLRPSNQPSVVSSRRPSNVPTTEPSMDKSQSPTVEPSLSPSKVATSNPTQADIEDVIDGLIDQIEASTNDGVFEDAIDEIMDELIRDELDPSEDLMNITDFMSDAPSFVPSQAPSNHSP